MKQYKVGCHYEEGMTVGEVCEALSECPQDVLFLVAYEGIYTGIKRNNIEISTDHGDPCVFINAE
jgi:hypothetical protein